MKGKKILTMLMAMLMLMSTVLTGCSGGASNDLLAQIKERGEIIIAMEGTWAPWTYHDENDQLVGYDVEVAQLIAEKLGVKATFVEGEWDGLLAGLDSKRYDILVNGVDIMESRQEKYDFTTPYAYNHTVIIVRGDNEDIHSLDDLAGKKTANTISGIFAEMAESHGAEVTGVTALNQSFELLAQGRVDATLNDEVTYLSYVRQHPEADVKIAARTDEASSIAIPLRKEKETETLRAEISKILEELSKSGKLSELSLKYFGIDISQAS